MSSYDQYFFGTQKYGLQAFQNRAGKYFTTSQSIFTTSNASAKKRFFTSVFGGDENSRKWAISARYVWCSKKRLRYRKIIPDTVLESLDSILLGSWKILTLRTHPEELRGLQVDQHYVSNTLHWMRSMKCTYEIKSFGSCWIKCSLSVQFTLSCY